MKFCFAFASVLALCQCGTSLDVARSEHEQPAAAEVVLDCPHVCPRIYLPVCAAAQDGEAMSYKYFPNECLVRYERCHGGLAWTTTRSSLCLPHVDPLLRRECETACPYNYAPVCATNGRVHEIFDNECLLGVENCLDRGEWITTEDKNCSL